jgi:hypothetical protein
VVGDAGVIASSSCQGRPQLSRLLARYAAANVPDLRFSSIQVPGPPARRAIIVPPWESTSEPSARAVRAAVV